MKRDLEREVALGFYEVRLGRPRKTWLRKVLVGTVQFGVLISMIVLTGLWIRSEMFDLIRELNTPKVIWQTKYVYIVEDEKGSGHINLKKTKYCNEICKERR